MTFNKSTGTGVRGSGSEAHKSPTQEYLVMARDESEGSEAPDSDSGWPCQGIFECDSGSLKDIKLGSDTHVHVEDICGRNVGGGVKAGGQESNRDGVMAQVCAGEVSLWQQQEEGSQIPRR